MLNLGFRNPAGRFSLRVLAITCVALLCSVILSAQATPGLGAIRGMVYDSTGTALAGASITVTNPVRASVVHVTTGAEGVYFSGPLEPGEYTVKVEAKGFTPAQSTFSVRVAEVAEYTLKLTVGTEKSDFEGPTLTLDHEQPTVQSMLHGDQLDIYPLNSRNFLDLAQVVPGVQFQDGSLLNAGKTGLDTISFQSQYGRDARVEVDGVSISDENVGGLAQNLPAGAVQEFNLSRSMLDLPTGLTSNGVVNLITRSGSDDLHGEATGFYLGHQGSAALPGSGSLPFQREQYGARAGGAIIQDKLFWFLDGERLQQNVTSAEPFAPPFNSLGTSLSQPLREFQGDARLDWQRRPDAHGFYRFGFDQVSQVRPFGASSSLQEFKNSVHSPSNTVGYDFNRGLYTHSFRFEYLRTASGVADYTGTIPVGPDNPIPGLGLNIGASSNGLCTQSEGGAFCSGPSPLAPSTAFDSTLELRYDGTRVHGTHVWRYGITYNRIQGAQIGSLFMNPQVGTTSMCLPNSTITVPYCVPSSDPTAYPADFAYLGNGVGYSTAQSAFGNAGGGLGPDNQIQLYGGDAWKAGRTFTMSYGLRYIHDTGHVANNGSLSVLNEWQPGLSNQVHNPAANFAPQFGFAWDAGGTGRTVIRAGAGLYYASSLWNDTLLDARARSTKGLLADPQQVCGFGVPMPFTWPTSLAGNLVGSTVAGGAGIVTNPAANQIEPSFCGSAISSAANPILALNSAFQSAAATAGAGPNINYVGTSLSAVNANGLDVFSPNYRTPRSYQMNLGLQEELSPRTILTVDYVRQVGEHSLMILDANHSGAARSYNYVNAEAARDATQAAAGCPPGMGNAQCVVTFYGGIAGAQAAYSAAGLDSNSATAGGAPCSFCAFPGITPIPGQNNTGNGSGSGALGTLDTLSTAGRSLYTGYQIGITHRIVDPMLGVKEANFRLAYTYSKYVSQGQDSAFPTVATDNDAPLLFTGPNALDRKHQFSLSGVFDLAKSLKLSMIAHLYSPIAQNLLLPELTNGGEIYATDWVGAGLGSGGQPEPVEGTQIGQYMRATDKWSLPRVINTYNTNFAGTFTPAGHCLVADQKCPGNAPIEVMTPLDMQTLNWVMPNLPSAPFNAEGPPWLKTVDLKLYWPIKVGERFVIEPSAAVFNVLNFANGFGPGNTALQSLVPGPNPNAISNGLIAPNAVGGVTGPSFSPFRSGLQGGTFALGSPRQLAFGLKISF